LTLGWNGQLAVSRGGTGVSTATANTVFAGPTTGAAAAPTFRALVAADIPALPYGTGTVTSVAALTLGTTGTDLSSTVANSTTTPVITLNVPTASATNRGALSAADWTTFNNKQPAGTYVTLVTGTAPVVSSGGTTPAISMAAATTSVSGYLTSTDWNTFNNKQPAGSYLTAVTADAPLSGSGTSGSHLVISQSTTSTNGYLSSTDWNTFNNKQAVSAPVTKTADFTVAATDLWLINNKSGSTCTATLPTASSYSGRVLHFQNYQAQTVVSASSNVVPIVGGSAGTSILLASAGDQCTLVSDGTNWLMTQYVPNNILLLE
jgi:hypothetical protein